MKRKMRSFKLFDLWSEDHDGLEMEVYRNKSGDYIAARSRGRRPGLVKFLDRLQIAAELSSSDSVCCIGKSEVDGKWYGWSHRAIFGFGLGDRIFDEGFAEGRTYCSQCEECEPCKGEPCPSSVLFRRHGNKTITADHHARAAAVAFASSVG